MLKRATWRNRKGEPLEKDGKKSKTEKMENGLKKDEKEIFNSRNKDNKEIQKREDQNLNKWINKKNRKETWRN